MDGITVPPGGTDLYDTWGNIRGDPVYTVEERHGEHFIKIIIYKVNGLFYYGYQIKVGTMIKQSAANIGGASYSTADLARSSASVEIEVLCNTNRNVLKLFAGFTKIRYNQGSLFEGV